jgi:hypothetical protein
MTLICCLAVPVLAYTYLWRTPLYPLSAGIILRDPPVPSMQLGFYWDVGCTLPVTTIDFGEIMFSTSGTMLDEIIFIRNEGGNWTTIFWNSTLPSVTTAMTEDWEGGAVNPMPLNSTGMMPGYVLMTMYRLWIQASPPTGTYNWTLTVWGECYL